MATPIQLLAGLMGAYWTDQSIRSRSVSAAGNGTSADTSLLRVGAGHAGRPAVGRGDRLQLGARNAKG